MSAKLAKIYHMSLCLSRARLVRNTYGSVFCLESQPCQPAVISETSAQQLFKQAGGRPASGDQRCVSDHGQLVCMSLFLANEHQGLFLDARIAWLFQNHLALQWRWHGKILWAKLWRRRWRMHGKWCLHYRYMQIGIQLHSDNSLYRSEAQTCVTVCFKALLLHGSLPEDEQDVSLGLDQAEADQQVVMLNSLFFPPVSDLCSVSEFSILCLTGTPSSVELRFPVLAWVL